MRGTVDHPDTLFSRVCPVEVFDAAKRGTVEANAYAYVCVVWWPAGFPGRGVLFLLRDPFPKLFHPRLDHGSVGVIRGLFQKGLPCVERALGVVEVGAKYEA